MDKQTPLYWLKHPPIHNPQNILLYDYSHQFFLLIISHKNICIWKFYAHKGHHKYLK